MSVSDIANTGKMILQNLSKLITVLQQIFPRVTGKFTLTAAATRVVAQPGVTGTSVLLITPINATAATLMSGSKSLYHDQSANIAGASFTVKTADGTNAAGTEQFSYVLVNPS